MSDNLQKNNKPKYIPFRLLKKEDVKYRIAILKQILKKSKFLLKKLSWVFNRDPNDETIPDKLPINIYVRGTEPYKKYSDGFHADLKNNIFQIENLDFSSKVEYDDRTNADYLQKDLISKIDQLNLYFEIIKICECCICNDGLYYYDYWLEDQYKSWIVYLKKDD